MLHFGLQRRMFRDVPHLFHLGSHIVSTSPATPEDLNVQLTEVGVGTGLARVSRISNFTDREAPSGKYSTCERWPYMWFKKLRTKFSPPKQSFRSVGCWHIFCRQHFLRSSRLSIKFHPPTDPLPTKGCKGPSDSVPGQPRM